MTQLVENWNHGLTGVHCIPAHVNLNWTEQNYDNNVIQIYTSNLHKHCECSVLTSNIYVFNFPSCNSVLLSVGPGLLLGEPTTSMHNILISSPLSKPKCFYLRTVLTFVKASPNYFNTKWPKGIRCSKVASLPYKKWKELEVGRKN
jgi:hypothetical protein